MTTFHAQIKLRSDSAHREAEEAPFIAELMGGTLSTSAYLDYLKALAPIYQRMEQLFTARGSEEPLSYFDHRALDRAEFIAADISYLEGASEDTGDIKSLPSISNYLKTLHDEISPVRLTAHHYIRYLGDLSGGQAIARLVARHYQIPAEALNFYNFEDIGDIVFYKKRYRDFLNLIALDEVQQEEFLSEVELLYKLNRELFMDLGNLHCANKDFV